MMESVTSFLQNPAGLVFVFTFLLVIGGVCGFVIARSFLNNRRRTRSSSAHLFESHSLQKLLLLQDEVGIADNWMWMALETFEGFPLLTQDKNINLFVNSTKQNDQFESYILGEAVVEVSSLELSRSMELEKLDKGSQLLQVKLQAFGTFLGYLILEIQGTYKLDSVPTEFYASVKALACLLYMDKAHQRGLVERELYIEAERMSSVGQMANGMAHEINNPLAIIDGYTGMLQKALHRNQLTAEFLQKPLYQIHANCSRITKIIKNLQTFSSPSPQPQEERLSVYELVHSTLDFFRQKLEMKDCRLIIDEIEAHYFVYLDKADFVRALFNIISYAYNKVISQGGDRYIHISSQRVHGKVHIRVQYSGTSDAQRMNDQLHQVSHVDLIKTHMLGISMANTIFEKYQGQVDFLASKSDSCFEIILPLDGLSLSNVG